MTVAVGREFARGTESGTLVGIAYRAKAGKDGGATPAGRGVAGEGGEISVAEEVSLPRTEEVPMAEEVPSGTPPQAPLGDVEPPVPGKIPHEDRGPPKFPRRREEHRGTCRGEPRPSSLRG